MSERPGLSIGQWTRDWAREIGLAVWYQAQIDSTNLAAKKPGQFDETHPALFIADSQSAGRGRGTNSWSNGVAGANLLSSWRFPLKSAPQHIAGPLFGLALLKAASKIWKHSSWALKPPNDLLLNGKKVAGILLESCTVGNEHSLVVGIGFNVGDHPASLPHASHLLAELKRADLTSSEWSQFLAELFAQMGLSAEACRQPSLPRETRQALIDAFNASPHLREKYSDVTPFGDLVSPTSRVRWEDL